jgi:hypothetical protein
LRGIDGLGLFRPGLLSTALEDLLHQFLRRAQQGEHQSHHRGPAADRSPATELDAPAVVHVLASPARVEFHVGVSTR